MNDAAPVFSWCRDNGHALGASGNQYGAETVVLDEAAGGLDDLGVGFRL